MHLSPFPSRAGDVFCNVTGVALGIQSENQLRTFFRKVSRQMFQQMTLQWQNEGVPVLQLGAQANVRSSKSLHWNIRAGRVH